MKRVMIVLIVLILTTYVYANSAPVVSNVSVSQRADDSKLVDIYYNLADSDGDNCTVWVLASDNGGSTWNVPAFTLIGTNSHGSNVTSGTNKHIVWDAGQDIPGKIANLKIRVLADDGKGEMEMVFVPAGSFKYQNSTWIQLGSYFMGKYEVTCQQYCEFLNNADPDGDYYYSSHPEIYQYGEAGNYSYSVVQGTEDYPVRYVSFYDAQAYAAWLSSQTGRNYHLPDQYEWQKAAGWSPDLQKLWTYAFQSDNISSTWCNYNNYYGGPLPVGSFDGTDGKNDAYSYYGCYDMSGNVWEWTTEPDGSYRVIRGGHWSSNAAYCAVTYRYYYYPSYRSNNYGFRLVLDLD